MISNECDSLLSAAASFHPMYGDRLANHLPMALIALDRMGATAAQMQKFSAAYSPKLRKLGDVHTPVDPLIGLGSGENFEGVLCYFRNAIKHEGSERVLLRWIRILAPGVAASAFHALIRLAYAVEAGSDSEKCFALAYWATEFQPLSLSMSQVASAPGSIVADLSRAMKAYEFSPGIIIDRMQEIARHPVVRIARIQPEAIVLKDIARFALSAYSQKEDFTLLHTVTACHALRVLEPYFDNVTLATRYLWQSIAMAYLTTELVYREDAAAARPERSEGSWDICLEKATNSVNDHVIKLTYTAWQEAKMYSDASYLAVAHRQTS